MSGDDVRRQDMRIQSRDRNGIALPDGWAVYHDGSLVFSVSDDKWDTIGPAVTKIMGAPETVPPALPRQRVVSLSGLHGVLEGAGYSPVAGVWTAEVLWDGDIRLTSVPISGIEPEYPGSNPEPEPEPETWVQHYDPRTGEPTTSETSTAAGIATGLDDDGEPLTGYLRNLKGRK